MAVAVEQKVIWQPQEGPQTDLLECPVFEVFYGGARGGGKTEGSIGDWLQHSSTYGEHAIGIFFRRKLVQLAEVIARTKQLFPKLGAKYNEQKKEWQMANGARLKFAYLERDSDAEEYQGHNYCVALGTPILMASGTYLPIEQVEVDSLVMTLQGPRRVLGRVAPYRAPCVRASVLAEDGRVLASQIQPVWHPLASTVGLNESHTDDSHQIPQQSPPSLDIPCKLVGESVPYTDPMLPGWTSYSAKNQSGCTVSVDAPSAGQLPPPLSFQAVLHEPSLRLAQQLCSSSDGARQYRDFPPVSAPASSHQSLGLPPEFQDFRQSPELSQLWLDHGDPSSPSALAYEQLDSKIAQDSPLHYLFDYDPCGELVPSSQGISRENTPSPADVAAQSPALPSDELGTIPRHNHYHLQQHRHPYSGEVLHLSEGAVVAQVQLVPCGDSLVSDLQIEGNNQYISFGGFINKNTRVYVEEVTNFPSPSPINKLRATLRSGSGVPVGMRLTGNPGGAGHNWVKKRYIDPCVAGYKLITEEEEITIDGVTSVVSLSRVFIPSKIGDNILLMRNDPTYILRLRQSGSEALVKAWLEGDWNIVDGAFFDEFDVMKHVLDTNDWLPKIPKHTLKFRAFDWGSAKPFSVGWYAVSDGTWGLPKGALLKYAEWYGSKGPNVGLKLTSEQVAEGILLREKAANERMSYGVADPAIFIRDGGPSIGENMIIRGCSWKRADNRRKAGWNELRQRLSTANGPPLLYFLDCCEDTIRTLPTLQHDEIDSEDLDTDAEDHAADELRYAVMSRPWVKYEKPAAGSGLPKLPGEMTIMELVEARKQNRLAKMED